jgi:hypothetical protein
MGGIQTALIGSFPSSIVTNGLVLNLDASNSSSYPGTGSTWFDISGNNRNATLNNSPTYSSSPPRITFNGSNQHADLGTWFNYNFFTISLWIKSNSSSQQQYADIIDNNHTGSQNFVMQMNNTTQNQYEFAVLGTGVTTTGLFNLTVGTWVNLVVTFNNSVVKFYRNGSLISTGSAIGSTNWASPNFKLARWAAGGRFWAGDFSQVLVYSRELSSAEITQNYNFKKSMFGL